VWRSISSRGAFVYRMPIFGWRPGN
jgi:hypothetical protein